MSFVEEHIWELPTRFRYHVFVEDGYSLKFIDTANDVYSPQIAFDKTRGSNPLQADDELGKFNFLSANLPYCVIQAHVDSVTSGSKAASFKFFVKAKGGDDSAPVQAMKLYGSTSVTNQADVELGNAGYPGEITLNGRVVGSNTFGTDANSVQSIIGDVTVSSTDTGNSPVWTIQTNPSGAGAASNIGTIKFRGKNDTPSLIDMANIYTSVTDVSAGSEDAEMLFQVMGAGNMMTVAKWNYLYSQYIAVQHEFNGTFAIKGLGSGLPFEPVLQLHNKDTTISALQNLGQIDFMNDDDDGTTLQIKGVATEDHVSNSNGGSKLEFYVTPDTTSSLAKAVTIGQDKSLTVEGDIIVNGNDIIFEGTSADAHELTLSGGNPGSDITVTLPSSTGTLALTSGDITGNALTASSLTSGNKTIDGNLTIGSNNDTTIHVIEREQVTGTNAGPDIRLKAGTASGDSQNGGDLCLYAGAATGNGNGGEIIFYSSNANAPSVGTVQEDTVIGRFYNNGGFRIEGDLTVVGNDIKDDDGQTCITFDSSGNTTIAGTLNASLTGNVTGNTSGSSGSCTGNAATATALETARNIGGVSFDGTANIDLPGVNSAGNQSTSGNAATATIARGVTGVADGDVSITSDGDVVVTLDSDNDETSKKFKVNNSSGDIKFYVDESGAAAFTAGVIVDSSISNNGTGNDLSIDSDGSMTFIIDRDNDETGQSWSFTNYNVEVANLNERGELQIDKTLTYGSKQVIQESVKVTLSTADCNALHTTPIQIAPAPGADKVIVPINGMIRVDRASTQLNSAADLNFHYADQEPGVANASSVVHFRRFMYNETGDRVFHLTPGMAYNEVSQNLTDDVNKALEVSVDSAFTTDCFTSVEVYLTYNIFDIS